jgi:hypothetical protein
VRIIAGRRAFDAQLGMIGDTYKDERCYFDKFMPG